MSETNPPLPKPATDGSEDTPARLKWHLRLATAALIGYLCATLIDTRWLSILTTIIACTIAWTLYELPGWLNHRRHPTNHP